MARILGIHPEVLIGGKGEVVVEVSHNHVGTWALEISAASSAGSTRS